MLSGRITWQPLSKRKVFSTRVFDIAEITSKSPVGSEHNFYTLEASDWVIVIPVLRVENTDHFLMVTQWRHGTATESIEFPGGVMDAGESPADSAKRELLEETGYKAETITHLATLSPNPAIMSNHCHVFLAEDLVNTHTPAPDDDEYITLSQLPVGEAIDKMGHGNHTHALMLSALFLYLQKKGVSVSTDTPI